MDKRLRFLTGAWLLAHSVVGQVPAPAPPGPVLTLAQCYELALAHAPQRRQQALNEAQAANNQSRLGTLLHRPQLAVNGQASYQSEVTRIPIEAPNISIPTLAKDQYRLTLDAAQTLYDGGTTRRQQELEELNSQVGNQQVEVSLYRLREQVNGLFFSALLADENARLRQSLRTDLVQRRKSLVARRANGVATGQDVARLDAEVLGLDQQLRDLASSRAGLLAQLGELLGQPLAPETRLAVPTAPPDAAARPEYALYDQQRALLARQQELNEARLAPRLSLYGQVGYGRPTLDFLRNDFHGYGLAGVRLNWNLDRYYTRRQDREATRLNTEAVAVQQAVFAQQQRVALAGQQSAIGRYQALLDADQQLIGLREKIQATAAVQLDNGIIGFSDYFTEANHLTQARLSEQLHRLQLLQAQTDELTTRGATAPPSSPTR
ncbi:TolC family protein [Hymenobacter sp.]|uniref:TolC family protein n=1 Tax=Hymenobacter sp. TaxID=1898978 RepID=UPI00286A4331|nr:TolC family protein [Hymenobacter sp.]